MKIIVTALLFSLGLMAQNDSPVTTASLGNPALAYQTIPHYTSGNLDYFCKARSIQNIQTITVSAASNANPVSFTATAHGFDYQSKATTIPAVAITGGTGSWAAINGVWAATPTGANTFTIAVDSTAFGALTGTLVVTTRAPLTTSAYWSIFRLIYDSSANLISQTWASKPGGAGANPNTLSGGSPSYVFACASETTYAFQ